ncbi:hypothetical protein ACHAXR_008399 [Thalassiosira sp. AJA248-18]
MVLKLCVDLILDSDANCVIMEVLQGDNLMKRCPRSWPITGRANIFRHTNRQHCIDPSHPSCRIISSRNVYLWRRMMPILERRMLMSTKRRRMPRGKTARFKFFAKLVKELQGVSKKARKVWNFLPDGTIATKSSAAGSSVGPKNKGSRRIQTAMG